MSNVDILITKSEIFSGCQKLTSFEGREASSLSGESLYSQIHVTEQDEDLIWEYGQIAAHELEQALGKYVYSSEMYVEDEDDEEAEPVGVKLTLVSVDTRRISRGTIDNMCHEAIYAFVMTQWLSNKLPQRMEFYSSVFTEMCKSILSGMSQKRKPTLADLDDTEVPAPDATEEAGDDEEGTPSISDSNITDPVAGGNTADGYVSGGTTSGTITLK